MPLWDSILWKIQMNQSIHSLWVMQIQPCPRQPWSAPVTSWSVAGAGSGTLRCPAGRWRLCAASSWARRATRPTGPCCASSTSATCSTSRRTCPTCSRPTPPSTTCSCPSRTTGPRTCSSTFPAPSPSLVSFWLLSPPFFNRILDKGFPQKCSSCRTPNLLLTNLFSADDARQSGCGVLVHCLAGISRSVTVTVAYLMSTLSLSLEDAYELVKRHKPNIAPNLNFMGQLLDFERRLYGENVPPPVSGLQVQGFSAEFEFKEGGREGRKEGKEEREKK